MNRKQRIEVAENSLAEIREMQAIVHEHYNAMWDGAENGFVAYAQHMKSPGPKERATLNELANEAAMVVKEVSKKSGKKGIEI